jgi:hypothetical protein
MKGEKERKGKERKESKMYRKGNKTSSNKTKEKYVIFSKFIYLSFNQFIWRNVAHILMLVFSKETRFKNEKVTNLFRSFTHHLTVSFATLAIERGKQRKNRDKLWRQTS